ncbi:response regulator [Nitrospiraceae bacterium AH_259_D15_M11_P09]|nr:response regulator [Nitrospiraceae bacterium AH_259_D15_M11_P09]
MAEPKSSSFFGSTESSNGCVMVVEDEPTVRNAVRQMLEKARYDVLEVEEGEKAIATIGSGENPLIVDVIITDIDKPKGMETLAYFKKQHPRISLVALTGLSDLDRGKLQQTKIVILGGGKGGTALLGLLSHIHGVEIIGIADKDPSAPALKRARELGIPVSDDIVGLISREGTNLIVDVTGDPEMARMIADHMPAGSEVLGGAASKLLWNVVQHEARMQTQLLQTEKVAGLVKAGMIVNYLVKPVEEQKLNDTVVQAMEQREIARL